MYSNSDISFKGNNYDFTLFDVEAMDRQSKFDLGLYLNPGTITIPQYNLRIGYYLNDKYDISIGVDHMKYVMRAWQASTIDGETRMVMILSFQLLIVLAAITPGMAHAILESNGTTLFPFNPSGLIKRSMIKTTRAK